jgi:hypothetical protein
MRKLNAMCFSGVAKFDAVVLSAGIRKSFNSFFIGLSNASNVSLALSKFCVPRILVRNLQAKVRRIVE